MYSSITKTVFVSLYNHVSLSLSLINKPVVHFKSPRCPFLGMLVRCRHTVTVTHTYTHPCTCACIRWCIIQPSTTHHCGKSNDLDTILAEPQLIGCRAARDRRLIKNVIIDLWVAVVGWIHRIWATGGKTSNERHLSFHITPLRMWISGSYPAALTSVTEGSNYDVQSPHAISIGHQVALWGATSPALSRVTSTHVTTNWLQIANIGIVHLSHGIADGGSSKQF